ncbi:MAG: prolyl oligopeptidase family serine peptidase [Burkholderiales bacterium]|nr:prolyl oligopeptidase family serine peptidase [Opitutaceae bacterium]
MVVWFFAVWTPVVCVPLDAADAAAFEARVFEDGAGGQLPYQLLSPVDSRPGQKYPLVMFFHGAGERGADNQKQLKHGARSFLKAQQEFPCYVLVPQCPAGSQWVNMSWGAASGVQPAAPAESMRLALALLDTLEKQLPVDGDRIYVTGISMGGYATWDVITRFPERFAAAVPVCGGGDEAVAARAKGVPLWAFHSDDDNVVKVIRSRNMIAALRAAGGSPHYTEYHGLFHEAWNGTYAEPGLFPWLFAQRLGQPDRAEAKSTFPPVLPNARPGAAR